MRECFLWLKKDVANSSSDFLDTENNNFDRDSEHQPNQIYPTY
jgi:hypothetical protein